MATNQTTPTGFSQAFDVSNPMLEWWAQQWMHSATPMSRLQLAWIENLAQLMQQEAKFLSALAESSRQLSQCYETHKGDPSKLNACYQEIANEVADQQMERLKQVATLSHDIRKRIWEEL